MIIFKCEYTYKLVVIASILLLNSCNPFNLADKKTLNSSNDIYSKEQFKFLGVNEQNEIQEYCELIFDNQASILKRFYKNKSNEMTVNKSSIDEILITNGFIPPNSVNDNVYLVKFNVFDDSIKRLRIYLADSRDTTSCYISHRLNYNFIEETTPIKTTIFNSISKDSMLDSTFQYVIEIVPNTR